MRWSIWAAAVALALGGCGGSSTGGGKTSSAPAAAPTTAASPATCALAQGQALGLGGDSGELAKSNPPTAVTDKAITDADALKTSLTELKGEISGAAKQAQLDQYLGVVNQFELAVRAVAAGDYQAALGQLAGVAPEFGQMLSGLRSLCLV